MSHMNDDLTEAAILAVNQVEAKTDPHGFMIPPTMHHLIEVIGNAVIKRYKEMSTWPDSPTTPPSAA